MSEGMWPDEVVEKCNGLVEVIYAKASASSKKGTKQIGFKVKLLKTLPVEQDGRRTPFMNIFFSEALRDQNHGLASSCGLPDPPESAYVKSPPESFTPETDGEFINWAEDFVGKRFWGNITVQVDEEYGDKNRLQGFRPATGKSWDRFIVKYNKAKESSDTASATF